MGRIARTWGLIGQSFAILKSDEELMWLPIFSGIACLAVSVVVLSGGALLFLPELRVIGAAGGHGVPMTQGMWAWLFLFYLVNYFVVVFFNVALVSAASDRLAGGHATIDQGLQMAWARKGKILQWALLAATVGILLRMLEERVGWLGRLIVSFIGIAWTLATYFVVPVLAAEDLGPIEALYRSAELFRKTWGEEVVGGFSFGVIFTLLALPAAIFPLYGASVGQSAMIAGTVLAVVYWLLLSVVSAAVQGIFMAGLYQYATTGNVSGGFRRDDFAGAWQPKG
jgi:Family of unknown function (DUF6159)